MWSKTQKALNQRLADSLKDKVHYHCDAIRRGGEWWSVNFKIKVNKEDWLVANDLRVYTTGHNKAKLICPEIGYHDFDNIIALVGEARFDWAIHYIHRYINEIDMRTEFKDLIDNKEYFLVLFGILDRRVGKRTFKWIYDNINDFPKWMHKYINLRIDSEGWKFNKEKIPS